MNEYSVELQRKIDLSLHELTSLRAKGPCFRVVHRSSAFGSIGCTVGEEVFRIYLLSRSRAYFARFPLSQRLLFDNFARHRPVPRSAAQIACSMRTEKFYVEHGKGACLGRSMVRRFAPASIKEYIKRLRVSLAQLFEEAKLGADPCSVLNTVCTTSNEVLYVLRATVEWEHVFI